MPQASPETDAAIRKVLPGSADDLDNRAIKYLIDKGYTLTPRWEWIPPEGVEAWVAVPKDCQTCITYLIEEWDFGSVLLARDILARRVASLADSGVVDARTPKDYDDALAALRWLIRHHYSPQVTSDPNAGPIWLAPKNVTSVPEEAFVHARVLTRLFRFDWITAGSIERKTERTPPAGQYGAPEYITAKTPAAVVVDLSGLVDEPDPDDTEPRPKYVSPLLASIKRPGHPMKEAPKDRPILALVDPNSNLYHRGEGRLTTYGAHAEELRAARAGFHILEWGGSTEGGDPMQGEPYYFIPDWWFVAGSEFETPAAPVMWWDLPDRESE